MKFGIYKKNQSGHRSHATLCCWNLLSTRDTEERGSVIFS